MKRKVTIVNSSSMVCSSVASLPLLLACEPATCGDLCLLIIYRTSCGRNTRETIKQAMMMISAFVKCRQESHNFQVHSIAGQQRQQRQHSRWIDDDGDDHWTDRCMVSTTTDASMDFLLLLRLELGGNTTLIAKMAASLTQR